MRARMVIAYDGTEFCGWQVQDDVRTVEGDLRRALATILDRRVEEVSMQGASRTDSGVHALFQVAHFDYHEPGRDLWDFVRGLNGLTDDDVQVVFADHVGEDFNARFSARGKIYRYRLWSHRFEHPLQRRGRWKTVEGLRVDAMREAANHLVGEHDFEAFRASTCQAPTSVRWIKRVDVMGEPPNVEVVVEGSAFLKYMVRIIVGTLVEVGTGRLPPDVTRQMLRTGDRALGGITAPARGLTLERIFYPEHPWPQGPPWVGGAYLTGAG